MTTRQKLLWSAPYVGLFVVAALAGQLASVATEAPEESASVAWTGRIDHSTVNWRAVPPEADPAPRSVAAYD